MKKILKLVIIFLLTLFSGILLISAWTGPNGLIAEVGDIITTQKWNDLLNLVNSKKPTTISTNRDDTNINSTRYYGASYSDGSWKIDKETGAGTGVVTTTATNLTNTGVTYSSGWLNRATLNY